MNYVMIPCKWKQFIFHNVGRTRDPYSIAEAGLMAGGKEHKEGKQTLFFTPHDPFNSYASEMEAIAEIKKPKKIHYQIHVSHEVYWIQKSKHSVVDSLLTTCRWRHQPGPPGDISRADLSALGTCVPCPWPGRSIPGSSSRQWGDGSKSLEGNLPNSTNALTLWPFWHNSTELRPSDKGIVMYC